LATILFNELKDCFLGTVFHGLVPIAVGRKSIRGVMQNPEWVQSDSQIKSMQSAAIQKIKVILAFQKKKYKWL